MSPHGARSRAGEARRARHLQGRFLLARSEAELLALVWLMAQRPAKLLAAAVEKVLANKPAMLVFRREVLRSGATEGRK